MSSAAVRLTRWSVSSGFLQRHFVSRLYYISTRRVSVWCVSTFRVLRNRNVNSKLTLTRPNRSIILQWGNLATGFSEPKFCKHDIWRKSWKKNTHNGWRPYLEMHPFSQEREEPLHCPPRLAFVSLPSHALRILPRTRKITSAHARNQHSFFFFFSFIWNRNMQKSGGGIWCSFLHQWLNALKFKALFGASLFLNGEDKAAALLFIRREGMKEARSHCFGQTRRGGGENEWQVTKRGGSGLYVDASAFKMMDACLLLLLLSFLLLSNVAWAWWSSWCKYAILSVKAHRHVMFKPLDRCFCSVSKTGSPENVRAVLLKLSSFMQNNNYFFKRFAVVWMKRSVVCKLDPVLEFSFFCFLFFFPSSLLSGGGAWVELVSFVRGAEERHQTGCLYFFSPSSPHTRPKTSCPVTTHR